MQDARLPERKKEILNGDADFFRPRMPGAFCESWGILPMHQLGVRDRARLEWDSGNRGALMAFKRKDVREGAGQMELRPFCLQFVLSE